MNSKLITMPKYEAYKDSGVDWIGAIPSHWEVRRFKFLASITTGTKNTEDKKGAGEYPFYVRSQKPERINSYSFDGEAILTAGDGAGVGKVYHYVNGKFDFHQRVYKFSDFSKVIGKYLFNYLYVNFYNVAILGTAKSTVDSLRIPLIQDFMICFPVSAKEQKKITSFLDQKTTQIDEAIAIKEKQIALLKERKQIIIQKAVTGEIVWNEQANAWTEPAEIKDSGVDWIGKIPEHWKVEKLFGLCRFIRGNSAFAKDELLNNGKYVALQYGKTYKVDEVDDSYEFYVNEEFYKESQVVNFGDVIFISTSETIEDLGHSAIYNREEIGLIGGEQLLIKPNSDLLDHYYIYYSTKVFSKELRKYATGIKVFRFNINDLKTIYTVVPPKEEQREIVQHIAVQSKKIDQAIALQESQIEKLKEYKTTLINSAVTGKIKVA